MLYLQKHMEPRFARAHLDGDIHIHDLDFYPQTTTCTQIDLLQLFSGGFGTGHGMLREPQTIQSYAALACIAIQSNQNNQHGGQSIPNFDYAMAQGVAKSFRRHILDAYWQSLRLYMGDIPYDEAAARFEHVEQESGIGLRYGMPIPPTLLSALHEDPRAVMLAVETAQRNTRRDTYQAMEALIHNLNTMHGRAGAQVPFSSLNYGTDTSPEGRLAIRCLLEATQAGLGDGETPIFPVQIFRVKEGVNYNPGDPNYDLFQLAMETSAKRLFPNFSFMDTPCLLYTSPSPRD